MRRAFLLLTTLTLAACGAMSPSKSAKSPASAPLPATSETGTFDNHEQVWRAHEDAAPLPPAHVVVTIEPTPSSDWMLWRVHIDAMPALDATWAMHRTGDAWIPHRALGATTTTFDASQWAPLDACALRADGNAASRFATDVAACSAIAPGLGASAALLPLAFARDGEYLRVRLYADQARGADARADARLVQTFAGWAAINGAGPKADASSRDWHMDRAVRIGSEGGRYPVKYRDGNSSGYSLVMERLTYRDGNVPVLKLSVVDDHDGRTVAYAWANPEATRIGLNLGWVQVGLDREGAPK